jgi:hypothetical protein
VIVCFFTVTVCCIIGLVFRSQVRMMQPWLCGSFYPWRVFRSPVKARLFSPHRRTLSAGTVRDGFSTLSFVYANPESCLHESQSCLTGLQSTRFCSGSSFQGHCRLMTVAGIGRFPFSGGYRILATVFVSVLIFCSCSFATCALLFTGILTDAV